MPEFGRSKFQGLFEEFLYQRDVEVTRFPPVICPNGHRQERAAVVNILDEGAASMFCARCGQPIALPEIGKTQAVGEDDGWIQREEALARLRSLYEAQLVRVKGFKRDRAAPRCYVSHVPAQGEWATELARDLREAGVYVLEDRAQILENDFIVMVNTSAYKQAWNRAGDPLAADAVLIRARFKQAAGQSASVIPLMIEDDTGTVASGKLGDFRDPTRYAIGLFDLVLKLYTISFDHPGFVPLRKMLDQRWQETLGRLPEAERLAAAAHNAPLKIFISYAHKDEPFKDELATMLAGLQRRGVVDAWQDRRIEIGDEWYRAIQDTMNGCDLALLLVSPDFLASRFIHDEELARLFQRRKAQGLRVAPIVVRECLWQSEPVLKDLQALPKDGQPVIDFPQATGAHDRVWTEIAQAIEAIAKKART